MRKFLTAVLVAVGLIAACAPAYANHLKPGEAVFVAMGCFTTAGMDVVAEAAKVSSSSDAFEVLFMEGVCFRIMPPGSRAPGLLVKPIRVDTLFNDTVGEVWEVVVMGINVYVGFLHEDPPVQFIPEEVA